MNIAGNRSNKLISIAYIINQCHSKFLYPITFFQFFFCAPDAFLVTQGFF